MARAYGKQVERPRYSGGTTWSVTQILSAAGVAPDFTGIPRDRLMAKAAMGTVVHELIESYLRADGSFLELHTQADEKALFYFDCWMKFFESCKEFEPLHLEGEMVTPRYAGTVDFVGKIDGTKAVCDWKTSIETYPHYRLQLTGYLHLASEVFKINPEEYELWCVRLTNIGKVGYKIDKYEPDHATWLGCLSVFEFKLRNGLWPT